MVQAANGLNSEKKATINHFLCLTSYARYGATKNKRIFFTLIEIISGAIPWSPITKVHLISVKVGNSFFPPNSESNACGIKCRYEGIDIILFSH